MTTEKEFLDMGAQESHESTREEASDQTLCTASVILIPVFAQQKCSSVQHVTSRSGRDLIALVTGESCELGGMYLRLRSCMSNSTYW